LRLCLDVVNCGTPIVYWLVIERSAPDEDQGVGVDREIARLAVIPDVLHVEHVNMRA